MSTDHRGLLNYTQQQSCLWCLEMCTHCLISDICKRCSWPTEKSSLPSSPAPWTGVDRYSAVPKYYTLWAKALSFIQVCLRIKEKSYVMWWPAIAKGQGTRWQNGLFSFCFLQHPWDAEDNTQYKIQKSWGWRRLWWTSVWVFLVVRVKQDRLK